MDWFLWIQDPDLGLGINQYLSIIENANSRLLNINVDDKYIIESLPTMGYNTSYNLKVYLNEN